MESRNRTEAKREAQAEVEVAEDEGPPLPEEIMAARAEIAAIAKTFARISQRLDQDCGTARMVMKAAMSRHGRSELLSDAVAPILSASLYYAAGDLDQVYPKAAQTLRAIKALAEKYGT